MVSIAWTGNGNLLSIYLLPSQLWTSNTGVISPHVFSHLDWIPGSNADLAPNAPKDFTFQFNDGSHQDHDATIVFDNGCVIKPPITK